MYIAFQWAETSCSFCENRQSHLCINCGDFNLFGDNTATNDKFHRPINLLIESRTGPSPRAGDEASVQTTKIYCGGGGRVLGHRIDAESSPKAASEKPPTTVYENRYRS